MGLEKPVVRTIRDAIGLRDRYPGAIGFAIAALKSKTGQRGWLALSANDKEWVSENVEDAHAPEVDVNPDSLPPLPESPIGVVAFVFIDKKKMNAMKPEIWIDEGYFDDAIRPAPPAAPPPPPAQAAPPPPPPSTPIGAAETLGHMFPLIKDLVSENRLTIQVARTEIQLAQVGARTELEMTRKEREDQIDRTKRELADALARVKEVEGERDAFAIANQKLSTLITELQSRSELGETIRTIYKDKPELFHGGVEKFIMGAFNFLADKAKAAA